MINRRSFLSLAVLALIPSRLFAFVTRQREPDETAELTQWNRMGFKFELHRYGKKFRVFFMRLNQPTVEMRETHTADHKLWHRFHASWSNLSVHIVFRYQSDNTEWLIDSYQVEFKKTLNLRTHEQIPFEVTSA